MRRFQLTLIAWAALATAPLAAEPPVFVDVAPVAGLDFIHFNGMSGEYYFAEIMGSGGALWDYDGDGDLDVYLVQGSMLGDRPESAATFPPHRPPPATDRLFRNDLAIVDGATVLRFVDVTEAADLRSIGYGMGVAIGDYDNDGDPDLYVTNFGANQLYANRGDGTFDEVTGVSKSGDSRWSVAAAFFDYDADGWLDLYVGNYTTYTVPAHRTCPNVRGEKDYCGPAAYPAAGDRLLRNQRNGTFVDVTARSLRGNEDRAALGAVSADFDGDGRLDLYVANDLAPNNLWLNRGDGTFVDEALLAGCATNVDGSAEASMGLDAGDVDLDGDLDLFMTHVVEQTNTLYRNDGSALFTDRTRESGLGAPSWSATGFGTAFVDFDLDGQLDLAVVNGAVNVVEEQVRAGDPLPLRQPGQLFHGLGEGRFEPYPVAGALGAPGVGRGMAVGDVDLDGAEDLLLTFNSEAPRLAVNRLEKRGGAIGLSAVLGSGRRPALGSALMVETGNRVRRFRVGTDGSYGSARAPAVVVGLGDAPAATVRLELAGRRREWRGLDVGRCYLLPAPGDAR